MKVLLPFLRIHQKFSLACGDDDKRGIDYCELYYSNRNPDGSFNEPELMNLFRDTSKFNVRKPSLSSQMVLGYSFSATPYEDMEGMEVYVCQRINGQWSVPENLGPKLIPLVMSPSSICLQRGHSLFFF